MMAVRGDEQFDPAYKVRNKDPNRAPIRIRQSEDTRTPSGRIRRLENQLVTKGVNRAQLLRDGCARRPIKEKKGR